MLSWLFGKKSSPTPTVNLSGPGHYDCDIVGESYYQPALKEICGGKSEKGHQLEVEAVLVHDNTNPYDNKAIRVDIRGRTVGHLSRALARSYRKRLEEIGYAEATASVAAIVVGGWKRGADEGYFGVKLDLPVED